MEDLSDQRMGLSCDLLHAIQFYSSTDADSCGFICDETIKPISRERRTVVKVESEADNVGRGRAINFVLRVLAGTAKSTKRINHKKILQQGCKVRYLLDQVGTPKVGISFTL